ncbi:glycoside hydrolase family 30 protein [Konateibacter massiliensis]|uniref:glycoside hydrolase family 30 protein n=1 Tax=Konateibacter massiliensis TaxID=2002841 RepID=UPI000C14D91A|nr:glycoside hydrolase family 30 beta sandwich domain-containing protein [Konateibacter massiliensis]
MKNITEIKTDTTKEQFWAEKEYEAKTVGDCMHVVNVYPEVKYQNFRGFGGAFTEASAHNYALLSNDKKKNIIADYFSKDGLRYNFGRVHMNSCDFGLGNYTYIEDGDVELKTFDIAHDYIEIIPMIMDAQAAVENPMEFLMTPWSPPPFFKTNGDMNHGGKLKAEYYQSWAEYFVKFIRAYEAAGIHIGYLTIQNEPMAVQTWDSCVYTSEEESLFVREHLGPTLEAAGLGYVKMFVWDHNKEEAYQRFKETVADANAEKYIAGAAVHWYTGDHFDSIELIKRQYPDKEVFFTEGCVEYSRFADSGEVEKAEMYAHDILGNLNGGINASLDWNLLLDEKGGPNHVGNFCAAPLMCNPSKNTYEKRLTYYYIGQFSRYIKAGAVRIGTTKYSGKLEVTGFLNPDGERVIVVLNTTKDELPVTLREEGLGIETAVAPHSIQTYLYK